MVAKIADADHEILIHDMQQHEIAVRAKQYGIRSLPAVVIDGRLIGCCPDEHVLREELL
jgi:glutaredoxin